MQRSTRNFLRWTAVAAALVVLSGAEAGTAIATEHTPGRARTRRACRAWASSCER